MFTPDFINAFGEGLLVADGDSAYASNGSWVLIFPSAVDVLPSDVLFHIHKYDADKKYLNWKILAARHLDWESELYIPFGCRKAIPIFETSGWQRSNIVNKEGVRKIANRHLGMLYDPEALDLNTMFETGKAEAVYHMPDGSPSRITKAEGFKKERGEELHGYIFRHQHLILAVHAAQFLQLHEAGFKILGPTRKADEDPLPPFAFHNPDREPYILGLMMPLASSGISVSPDGRKLWGDASRLCWNSVEEGVARLQSYENYAPTAPDLSLPERIEDPTVRRSNPFAMYEGISILRIHGVSEEDIARLYEEGKPEGWAKQHKQLLKTVQDRLDEVNRYDLDKYGPGRLQYLGQEVVNLCNSLEELCRRCGSSLSVGKLPELVQILKDKNILAVEVRR